MLHFRALTSWFCVAPLLALGCSSPEGGDARPVAAARSPIVGGEPSPPSQDFVVALEIVTDAGSGLGSAVLIAPNVVLTARHCISGRTEEVVHCPVLETGMDVPTYDEPYDVSSFRFRKTAYSRTPFPAKVVKVFTPPKQEVCGKDIAALLLDRPLGPEPATFRETPVKPGEITTVVGLGVTATNSMTPSPERLQRTGVEVLALGPAVILDSEENEIMASPGEFLTTAGACGGDSGGPLLDADGAVVGLVMGGVNCETGPDVFTSIADNLPLIQEALIAGGNSPHPVPKPDAGPEEEDAGTEVDADVEEPPPAPPPPPAGSDKEWWEACTVARIGPTPTAPWGWLGAGLALGLGLARRRR